MASSDWQWKIGEVIERIRTRYEFIGRTTGAPFIAVIYPADAEIAMFREWHTQTEALRPEINVRSVNILDVTHKVLADVGVQNIVDVISDPMPGSDPQSELGRLWIDAVANAIHECLEETSTGKPVVSLEQLAALHPAATPRDVMQRLWDSSQDILDGPLITFIPGIMKGNRTYAFLEREDEFMYRGDLL